MNDAHTSRPHKAERTSQILTGSVRVPSAGLLIIPPETRPGTLNRITFASLFLDCSYLALWHVVLRALQAILCLTLNIAMDSTKNCYGSLVFIIAHVVVYFCLVYVIITIICSPPQLERLRKKCPIYRVMIVVDVLFIVVFFIGSMLAFLLKCRLPKNENPLQLMGILLASLAICFIISTALWVWLKKTYHRLHHMPNATPNENGESYLV